MILNVRIIALVNKLPHGKLTSRQKHNKTTVSKDSKLKDGEKN